MGVQWGYSLQVGWSTWPCHALAAASIRAGRLQRKLNFPRHPVARRLAKALAAGASETLSMDEGWMYQRGFADLDGHLWEYFYMDMNAIPPAAMSGGTTGK